MKEQGGKAELVGEDGTIECFRLPDYGKVSANILEILPVQMITLALAALAERR